jgi:NADH:ubiquinone oxidoreductase subunit K
MADFLAANVPSLSHWLLLTCALFAIGLYGMLTRRNAVGVLMSLELCLNAAAVNFVLFNRYILPGQGGAERVDGAVMAIFVIAVAAAEVVVGMAIFVAMYAERRTVDVTRLNALKD